MAGSTNLHARPPSNPAKQKRLNWQKNSGRDHASLFEKTYGYLLPRILQTMMADQLTMIKPAGREATGQTAWNGAVEISSRNIWQSGFTRSRPVVGFETMGDGCTEPESAWSRITRYENAIDYNTIARKKLYEMNRIIDTAEYGCYLSRFMPVYHWRNMAFGFGTTLSANSLVNSITKSTIRICRYQLTCRDVAPGWRGCVLRKLVQGMKSYRLNFSAPALHTEAKDSSSNTHTKEWNMVLGHHSMNLCSLNKADIKYFNINIYIIDKSFAKIGACYSMDLLRNKLLYLS